MKKPKQALMQIAGTRIAQLEIKNDFVMFPDESECFLDLEYEVDTIKSFEEAGFGNESETGYVATATLTTVAEGRAGDQALHVEISTEACFFCVGEYKEEFEKLVHSNGAATLYSIVRGQIISITSQCTNGGAIILPMLNFSEVVGMTKKEETNKEETNKE